MAAKIGISEPDDSTDELIRDLLSLMAEEQQDFTQTFTVLANYINEKSIKDDGHCLPAAFTPWIDRWKSTLTDPNLSKELMIQTNPQIIPRNHHIEEAIQSAVSGDYQPFHDMVEVLKRPFDQTLASSIYALAPKEDQLVRQTFCGT